MLYISVYHAGTSSSLNSLLSQPVDTPGGGGGGGGIHSHSIAPHIANQLGMPTVGNPHSPSTNMPPFNAAQVRMEAASSEAMEPTPPPPPSDFWDSLKEIQEDFKALASMDANDPAFAGRLVRAIDEVNKKAPPPLEYSWLTC